MNYLNRLIPISNQPFTLRGCISTWVAFACVITAGCGVSQDVDDTYGRRRGYPAISSVNGTSVLARVFEGAGHRVSSTTRLAKTVDQAQVVVWAPDSFKLPETFVCDHFENWLGTGDGRTLIYIARDYDAAVEYYRTVVEQGNSANAQNFQRGLAKQHLSFELRRQGLRREEMTTMPAPVVAIPPKQECPWFTLQREPTAKRITQLDGPWSKDIDPSLTNIIVWSKLVPLDDGTVAEEAEEEEAEVEDSAADDSGEEVDVDAETEEATEAGEGPLQNAEAPLADDDAIADVEIEGLEMIEETDDSEWQVWESRFIVTPLLVGDDGQILAMELRRPFWDGSRIVVIVNGSWLLNFPLVNHEHRKLAGHLIASCGTPGKTVFLETDDRGARISRSSDNPFWGLLKQRPLGAILMHLFALGMLYCFATFPIFGPARSLTRETVTDFGKHVIALGKRLAATRDAQYARGRLSAYQQFVRRDSGVSHVKDNVD